MQSLFGKFDCTLFVCLKRNFVFFMKNACQIQKIRLSVCLVGTITFTVIEFVKDWKVS